LAKRFEGGKYFTRISEPSFMMLMTFLQAHPTTALLNVIQKYFDIEIVGGTVQTMNNELKSENKKSCPFIKPNIEPIPPSELAMATPRRPHVPSSLPVPPNSDEVLMAKHDFQQKLTLASQQLDPSIPSILLCAVHTSKSVGLHCAAVTNKSETPAYACGREDSSIVVSSWLPRERGDSFNNIQTLRGHYGPIFGVDYSHDGRYLISSSEDTTVKLWDANSGDCLVKYSGHTYPVFDVSFSSVDGYFVTSSFDYTSRLWNTDRVYPLRIFTGHEDSVNVARFHPNGNYVATGSKDYTCRLWDINTGGCVRLLTGSKNPISALAFSPFGKHLASATTDGTITIWEISSGQAIRTLKEHTANITSLFYTCDSTLLASTSMDNTIKLWNVKAILSQNDSSGSINDKCLMHTQSVGPILPLHGQFTHRNCLVTIGVQYQDKLADNSIQTHFSKF
jgi:transcription initiation factor TFIID subunit 5